MRIRKDIVPVAERHVLAMGGAFGYDNDAGKKFLRLMLKLTGKRKPRIMFVGTASGDHDYGRVWFYSHLAGMNCNPTVLRLFEPVPLKLENLALSQDAIFVGGGNSLAQLGVWRAFGFDRALWSAWEHGVILGGASAGGICWFEQCVSASSYKDQVVTFDGLGMVAGSCSPHYDSDPKRRPAFHELVASGEAIPGYGIDECAALHIIGRDQVHSLNGAGDSACYLVTESGGKASEEKLPSETLSR